MSRSTRAWWSSISPLPIARPWDSQVLLSCCFSYPRFHSFKFIVCLFDLQTCLDPENTPTMRRRRRKQPSPRSLPQSWFLWQAPWTPQRSQIGRTDWMNSWRSSSPMTNEVGEEEEMWFMKDFCSDWRMSASQPNWTSLLVFLDLSWGCCCFE